MKDVKIQKAAAVCSLCGRPLHDITRHPSILQWIAEHDRIEAPPADLHEAAAAAEGDAPAAPNGEPVPSRVDVCPDCWAKDHQLDYLCYWLARRKPPKEKQRKDRKGRNAFLRELFYHYYNNEHRPAGEGGPLNPVEDEIGAAADAGASAGESDRWRNSPELRSAGEGDGGGEGEGEAAPVKSADELERERDLHLYLLAHLLMRYKVFQWKGAKTDRKKRRWLQFDDPALGQSVKIADLDPGDPALAAVHQELAALLAE